MVEPGLELSRTDRLAVQRTDLAVRRTWLASARTGLAMFVSGATFIKFFDEPIWELTGMIFAVGAVPVVIVGWIQRGRSLRSLAAEAHPGPTPPPAAG